MAPPAPAAAMFAAALLAVVATLVLSATSRHSCRRARLGVVDAFDLVALDVTMVVAIPSIAPALIWPLTIAVPVRLIRAGMTLRSLPTAGG
ncbi:MAG TPA: hypothetical protein VGQ92_24160 [Actinoplanes sp.]|nr:hypothetical protein [Actinoplanes sp.]